MDVSYVMDMGNHPPIFQRAYQRSPTDNAVIGAEVKKLLDSGLIEPSKSPWSSPLLLVKIKDGTNRV